MDLRKLAESLLKWNKPKPPPFPERPAAPLQPGPPPPQGHPYLEDKLWYESQLSFLFKFDEKLMTAVGLDEVVHCIVDAAYSFLPIDHAVFLTWDKATEKFTLAHAMGWAHASISEYPPIDKDSPFFTTKGTGLGLAICQNIIAMHGGTIAIKSQKNEGTRVIITLKVSKGGLNG